MLPKDWQLLDLAQLTGESKDKLPLTDEEEERFLIESLRVLLIYFERKGFPLNFREYILGDVPRGNIKREDLYKICDVLMRYNFFREDRENLQRLISLSRASAGYIWGSGFSSVDLSGHERISIDSDGIAFVHRNRFGALIEGVDTTRIRECPICERIFRARRKDQKYCTNRCGNVHRVRKAREGYAASSERYKWARYEREESKIKKPKSTFKRKVASSKR